MALLEGLFFSFELSAELSVAIGALVVLIALQAFIVFRRINVKRQGNYPEPASRAADVLKSLRQVSEKSPQSTAGIEKLDSGVFAKFESSLKRHDSKAAATAPAEEPEVIISLSSKSPVTPATKTAPAAALSKPQATQPISVAEQNTINPSTQSVYKKRIASLRKLNKSIKVEPIGNLFDDVRESLVTAPADRLEKVDQPISPNQPIVANEFLTGKDLALDPDNLQEGIDLVLAMAGKDFKEGRYEESLAAIRQYIQNQNKFNGPLEQLAQLIELKAQNEIELRQYDRASQTLQEVVVKLITKNSPDFLPMLEKYLLLFKAKGQEKHAVHFMFTALNEYRQLHDHVKMDQTYTDIEIAYRQLEDWPRLIQTYQNHLTIKKALTDHQGQLDILDQLGKLLYDQGEEDKSRKCYKQRLVIEKEMERSAKKATR
jgi:tetratricopeptide (TPR) repeat protein